MRETDIAPFGLGFHQLINPVRNVDVSLGHKIVAWGKLQRR